MLKNIMGMSLFATISLCSCQDATTSPTSTLVDPMATPQTQALYENLKSIGHRGTMFGHQDATAYGIGWKYEEGRSDVKSVTGEYPAVYGWEIGGIERNNGFSLDTVHFYRIKQLVAQAYSRGGVNTVSWHADNLVTGGDSWDLTGGNVVATILPQGVNHQLFTERLDILADFFLSLKSDSGELIPVLFRPFHEHTGSWFWWGRDFCSEQEYKSLWQFTVEYLRDTKGVHNLIWVYSPDRVACEQEYIERYPSDEYVDMLGLDLYHFNGADGVEEYRKCVEMSLGVVKKLADQKHKPYAFTETGLECVTIDDWFTQVLLPAIEPYRPAYVLVWRNSYEKPNHFYAVYPGHPACADFVKFKQCDNILFNGEIPNMYK